MIKNKIINIFIKGVAMGSVDIVPGISGGTMALILKIYPKIISEIKSINWEFLKNILNLKFKQAFRLFDWKFLLPLFLGIISAIISLAKIISLTLEYYPVYLYSLFFGLIITSALFLIPKKITNIKTYLFLLIGFLTAWTASSLAPASTPETYWFIFLSGALAICAMILPGISGAFILLLLGKYEFMISLLKSPLYQNNLILIIIFLFGCLVGLLSFAKLLNHLIKKYYKPTLMILIGFMLGSLNKIWPFKEVLVSRIINDQEIIIKYKNVWPIINSELFISTALLLIGVILGFYLGKIKIIEKNRDLL